MKEISSPRPPDLWCPLVLLAAAVTLMFAWNVYGLARQRTMLQRMRAEQSVLLQQSMQANENVRLLMMDLLTLAENDTEAKAIVDKHGIKFTPPATPPNPEDAPEPALEDPQGALPPG